MMSSFLPLLAQATRETFAWKRIQSNSDWIVPVAACVAILLFVRWMYRRDGRELGLVTRWLLTLLRCTVFLAVGILYLGPQWRAEREIVHPSRAIVMVDTSLSMAIQDSDKNRSESPSRMRQVCDALEHDNFLDELRATHEVVVLRFDEAVNRLASLSKLAPSKPGQTDSTKSDAADPSPAAEDNKPEASDEKTPEAASQERPDWRKLLVAGGRETRLGQALRQVISEQRSTPVSGIVLITDGGQNAGLAPETAVEMAQEAKIPIFPVGVGSDRRPIHVGIYEMQSPERAHPGDPYTVSGLIHSQGLAGKSVTVQLFLKDPVKGNEQLLESQTVTLGGDSDAVPVKFQVTPKETGRKQLSLRLASLPAGHTPDAGDDHREAEIEVVDRKNRVLLLAGGATREYQFLKSVLFRDRMTTTDVLLQTGADGVSQEANKVLEKFPATREELFGYDCIVAFDPNWEQLTSGEVDLLETWVAEQGGGMLLVAGPVYTGQSVRGWLQNPALARIRALYPVDFHNRVSLIENETYLAKEPWPLDFSREGREAEFLWLADGEAANQVAWDSFRGVFSYQPVRGAKQGATVYARFSDPRTAQNGKQPPYFVGQFYGSGRTFYLGSGEMWRLRRHSEGYFEQFYTRLVRHVSQGRMLRQSSRGMLLVDKDRYLLGNTVEVRAQLTDAQLHPLRLASAPLEVLMPNGKRQTITLRSDPSRAGMYAGQLTVLQEGAYRLELPIPASDNERLSRRIQVRMPELERDNPQRNDKLLSLLAEQSGGKYYPELLAALSLASADPLVKHLKDRTKTSIVPEAPDLKWEERWLEWMMLLLCGLLCIEWLVRRLVKLA